MEDPKVSFSGIMIINGTCSRRAYLHSNFNPLRQKVLEPRLTPRYPWKITTDLYFVQQLSNFLRQVECLGLYANYNEPPILSL